MIRMLHAADLHLDSPFSALAPEQAAQRREEQRQLLRRLGEECRRLDCHLLLLAGDLFDTDQIYRETAELLRQVLADCGARVFIAPGNHDPWSPRSPYATLRWPENVYIFHSRTPEALVLEDLDLTLWGAAFLESREAALLEDFHAGDRPGFRIMVLHGELENPDSLYNPISPAQVEASELDYLALGHVHRQQIRVLGKTTVASPGCAMGRGFDETGPKGALFVELDEAGCRVEPLPLGGRVYEELSVAVEADPLAEIQALLPPDTERDIYRVTLTGSCPKPDLAALRAALEPRFYHLELVDRTLPPLALWENLAEDSLKGEFLRQLKDCYAQSEDPEHRRLAAQAAYLGLALMEGREVPEL